MAAAELGTCVTTLIAASPERLASPRSAYRRPRAANAVSARSGWIVGLRLARACARHDSDELEPCALRPAPSSCPRASIAAAPLPVAAARSHEPRWGVVAHRHCHCFCSGHCGGSGCELWPLSNLARASMAALPIVRALRAAVGCEHRLSHSAAARPELSHGPSADTGCEAAPAVWLGSGWAGVCPAQAHVSCHGGTATPAAERSSVAHADSCGTVASGQWPPSLLTQCDRRLRRPPLAAFCCQAPWPPPPRCRCRMGAVVAALVRGGGTCGRDGLAGW